LIYAILDEKNDETNVYQHILYYMLPLFEAVDSDPPERIRPCDLQKLLNSLKLKKPCGIDGIPDECLRDLPRTPLVHLIHLINHCIRLLHTSPYVYDYITKSCRQQAEVIQNHENENVR
jgi:hypothetical protein